MAKRSTKKQLPQLEAPPDSPPTIQGTLQREGAAYRVRGGTRDGLERHFPDAPRTDFAHIGYGNQKDFEKLHGPWWEYLAAMLTGLNRNQLIELGGSGFVNRTRKKNGNCPTFPSMPAMQCQGENNCGS